MSELIPMGTRTKWGIIGGVQYYLGKRYYFIIGEDFPEIRIGYVPADAAEEWLKETEG